MNYSEKLRRFADYLNDQPELDHILSGYYQYPGIGFYCNDWEHFQDVVSHLGGYNKERYGDSLYAVHKQNISDDDNERVFQISISVSNVCERRPKLDEDGQPVMRPKRVTVTTDEMEPEWEYDCPTVWSK